MSFGRSRDTTSAIPSAVTRLTLTRPSATPSQVSLETRAGTHLNTLPSSQAAQNLLKQLPVNSVWMVKVELALERGVELGLVVASVERVLGEDHDVGDVVQAREDLFGDRRLSGWVIKANIGRSLELLLEKSGWWEGGDVETRKARPERAQASREIETHLSRSRPSSNPNHVRRSSLAVLVVPRRTTPRVSTEDDGRAALLERCGRGGKGGRRRRAREERRKEGSGRGHGLLVGPAAVAEMRLLCLRAWKMGKTKVRWSMVDAVRLQAGTGAGLVDEFLTEPRRTSATLRFHVHSSTFRKRTRKYGRGRQKNHDRQKGGL